MLNTTKYIRLNGIGERIGSRDSQMLAIAPASMGGAQVRFILDSDMDCVPLTKDGIRQLIGILAEALD